MVNVNPPAGNTNPVPMSIPTQDQVPTATAVPATDVSAGPTPVAAKPRRRWITRWLLLLGVGLAATAWFAPLIVAKTPLRHRVPKLLFPQYPGAIEVGSASLGWLQPVVVRDLRAEDADGHLLLDVKEFSTSLPLWKLAVSRTNFGRFTLVEPRISVELRPNGSNVEDVLASFFNAPRGSSPPAAFELEVIDATVDLDHKLASLTSTLSPVSLILQSTRGGVDELELTIGQVPSADEASLQPATDWLALRYGSQPTQDGVAMTTGSKHIRLKAAEWNLDKLLPALARFEPNAELSGIVDADARSQFNPAETAVNSAETVADWTSREWSWDGRITVKKFVLAGIPALKKDRVALEMTSLAGRVAAQQGRLSMDRVQLLTGVGELTATGDIPLEGLASASPLNAVRSILGEQDYTIHGHLDLQRLAVLLPNTLRVREGTEITGGRIDVNLKSESKEAGPRSWTADATVDQLTARYEGKAVASIEPVRVKLLAHRTKDAVTFDDVSCQSDFFTLTGQGTLADARFTANGDLTRLEENLQRFVDLGIDKLAGKIKAQGEIRRLEQDRISLETVVQLDDFHWNISKESVWHEPRLVLTVTASGSTVADTRLKRIDTAEIKLTSGQDSMVSKLLEGVDPDSKDAVWPFTAAVEGDLRSWQNRLRPFVGLKGWQLAGTAKIDATVKAGSKQIEIVTLAGTADNLDLRGPEWWIKEPQVKFDTAGIWSFARSEWTAPESTVTGTAITCRVLDLLVDLKPNGQLERVAGDAAYRGDLDKLSRWKNQALPRPYYHLMGTFEGESHLVEHDSLVAFDLDTTVTKFVVADLETLANRELHWVALWREPSVHLTGKGGFDTTTGELTMETASVETEGLQVKVKGSLADLSASQRVDLTGELRCDWDLVSQRMGDSLRKTVQLKGKQTRPLAIKGSLASLIAQSTAGQSGPVDLSANAGIGWDSAMLQGLPVGPADVAVRLEKGICQFAPIDTTLANGKLHLTPSIRLNRSPAILILPAEKVMDRVRMSPELCNAWLKFVAPLLADATQMEGEFSLDVAGASLPLLAPTTGDMRGTLGVHHVRVRPGGAALQVLGLFDQIKSVITRKPAGNGPGDRIWMQMPEQAIPFTLAAGRVHHQNVTFAIGDGIVQSSGSVGMDETIDLVLEIPFRDEWIKDQKLLAGIRGKGLKIPVRGTLSKPQFDSRVLTELASQIGGTALEGVLDEKLDDLFKKKFGKFLPGRN
jgi:hypothetical protein